MVAFLQYPVEFAAQLDHLSLELLSVEAGGDTLRELGLDELADLRSVLLML